LKGEARVFPLGKVKLERIFKKFLLNSGWNKFVLMVAFTGARRSKACTRLA
jgi:hypothetical protein